MHKYRFGEDLYFGTGDFGKVDEYIGIDFLEKHAKVIRKSFTKKKTFRRLLEAYGQSNELEGYIVLESHGAAKDGEWYFIDGKMHYNVQNWIDKMDGKVLALVLCCCNPENKEVRSHKSIVIHLNDSVNIIGACKGKNTKIYVPGKGYLDDYYHIKKAIKELK